jgi:hypothetical protein
MDNQGLMLILLCNARKLIDDGQVPGRLQELFPPDHLREIATSVGLPESSTRDLLAVAMASDEANNWGPGLRRSPKQSLIRKEVESIKSALQHAKEKLSPASPEARYLFADEARYVFADGTRYLAAEVSDLSTEIIGIEFGDDALEEAVPSIDNIINCAEKIDVPDGRPGPDKSAKYFALVYLKAVVIKAQGSCTRRRLTELANYVLEPVLAENDETRWRDMITEVLNDGTPCG